MRGPSRTPGGLAAILVAALGVVLCMQGCAGDDGDTIVGPAGPPGPGGTPGPIDTTIGLAEEMPGVSLEIAGISGATGSAFQVGDTISVTFTVKMGDGTDLPLSELDSARMWMAGPTTNYQKVTGNFNGVIDDSVDNGDGTYTFTFTSAIPATYPLQYYETGVFPEAGGLSGTALLDGTYTICFRAYKYYWDTLGERFRDVGNVTYDFLFGGATTIASRTVVSDDACNSCHGTLQMHGGSYRSVKLCVTCHTAGAECNDSNPLRAPKKESIDFRVMIHKLHNASHLPSVNGVTVDNLGNLDYTTLTPQPYMIGGHNFVEEVHFPVWPKGMPRDTGYDSLTPEAQDKEDEVLDGVIACAKCHVDPDGSGPLTLDDNNAFTQPDRRACGSCHDDVKWNLPYVANSATMPAQADDSGCAGCHPGSAAGNALAIQEAHRHPSHDATLNPGINTAITSVGEDTADPNANLDGTIDPGEKLQVTISLTDDSGANVDPTGVYRIDCLVTGPTENPQLFQRKYVPRDILGTVAQASYTFNVPAFSVLDYVGDVTPGTPVTLGGTRAPFHTTTNTTWSTDVQVFEVTGAAPTDVLAVASVPGRNHFEVTDGSQFAADDFIVLDAGGTNEEYYKIYSVDGDRLTFGRLDTGSGSNDFGSGDLEFSPWVRTAHAAGTTVGIATVLQKTITTDYTVDEANGEITTVDPGTWAGANPILVSAVVDWVMPDWYVNGYTRRTLTDGTEGSWIGLPIEDGTYHLGIGAASRFYVTPPRTLGTGTDDTQFYATGTLASGGEFLVGSATTLEAAPPVLLSSATNCDECHGVPGERLVFHGRRAGAEYCYTCHGTANFGSGSPVQGRRTMRQMIHGYHMGKNLTFASIFEGGRAEHIGFPMFPGGPKHCDKCHGNDDYAQPIERDHPNQLVPYKKWATPCLGCHDSTDARAHADLNTAPSGYEACGACHDPGSIYHVELVHKNR